MTNPIGDRRRTVSVPDLVQRAGAGQVAAMARLISWVENESPHLPEVLRLLVGTPPRAHVIGITGSPGVGKSTTTSALVGEFRARGRSVAVLAVDPSSPFSGGALLGDRVRMSEHATDPGVFIRSMASRGHLGGLSWATPQAVRVLDAAGFDVILVETVGVGQSEIEIAGLADTTLILLAPGLGDGIQAAKAGILEVGDLYVVNKADREGADTVRRDLRSMLSLAERGPHEWKRPVLKAVASSGEGISDVAAAVESHHEWLTSTGALRSGRVSRARREIEALAGELLRRRWSLPAGPSALDVLADQVVDGELDPYTAAEVLLRD